MRKYHTILVFFLIVSSNALSQEGKVIVKKATNGFLIQVGSKPFFVNGMNWDYYPIGTNFKYSLWQQPDKTIKEALNYEMPLLRKMGVNTIRQYTGIPPEWIKYIFQNYGIYTVLNHPFGRYGLTLNGKWESNTDYSNDLVRETLVKEVEEMVFLYKSTPGLLMFLLGNENNYGLFWQGAETENIPLENRKSTTAAINLYKLFNEAAISMKAIDTNHPIAICNGDLMFLDIIAMECKEVDVLGVNIYRGLSFGDSFEKIKSSLNKPVMFTEFGADAFNEITKVEDQHNQATCLVANWKEIYANAAGGGKAENCIGGFTFQFSDGWWKSGQTKNLSTHDSTASWSNGGYKYDYQKGLFNMNEEWFGVCAKGDSNTNGVYSLYPRASYYELKKLNKKYTHSILKNVQYNQTKNVMRQKWLINK